MGSAIYEKKNMDTEDDKNYEDTSSLPWYRNIDPT
jgi:hypothetical protein